MKSWLMKKISKPIKNYKKKKKKTCARTDWISDINQQFQPSHTSNLNLYFR